jgi:hypothetical protein
MAKRRESKKWRELGWSLVNYLDETEIWLLMGGEAWGL